MASPLNMRLPRVRNLPLQRRPVNFSTSAPTLWRSSEIWQFSDLAERCADHSRGSEKFSSLSPCGVCEAGESRAGAGHYGARARKGSCCLAAYAGQRTSARKRLSPISGRGFEGHRRYRRSNGHIARRVRPQARRRNGEAKNISALPPPQSGGAGSLSSFQQLHRLLSSEEDAELSSG
jgi:hypothetical protein